MNPLESQLLEVQAEDLRDLLLDIVHDSRDEGPFDFVADGLHFEGWMVGRVERHLLHDIWEVRLVPDPTFAGHRIQLSRRTVARHLRLLSVGIEMSSLVVTRRGTAVLVVFIWKYPANPGLSIRRNGRLSNFIPTLVENDDEREHQ